LFGLLGFRFYIAEGLRMLGLEFVERLLQLLLRLGELREVCARSDARSLGDLLLLLNGLLHEILRGLCFVPELRDFLQLVLLFGGGRRRFVFLLRVRKSVWILGNGFLEYFARRDQIRQ